jgi:N-acyl homoserine lactone hydrolase
MGNQKIKLYILDLGHLETDFNLVVSHYVVGLKSNKTPKTVWKSIPVTAVLIDHPTYGKILYDTGMNPNHDKTWPNSVMQLTPPYHSPEQTLEHQLELCGTTVNEIRTVVLSHMHLDHAGGLSKFMDKQIIVSETEFRDAFAYVFQKKNQEGRTLYLRPDIDIPVEEYTLINGDYDLCEGVKLISLPGHTDGMLGLQVDLEDFGTMLFTRDLCYTALNYGPPAVGSGFVANFKQYNDSIERVRKLAAETNAFLVFGHDPDQFAEMKHAPEYYE